MVFTLIGWSESEGKSSLLPLTALADEHVAWSGDDISVPELNKLIGAMALSTTLDDAQLSSPSLRAMFLEDLADIITSATVPTDEGGFNDFSKAPIELVRSEKLNALVDNNGVAEQSTVLAWLADGVPIPRYGDIRTIKATMTGITATYAWTNQAMTLSQTLPAGKYALVGARAIGTTLIAGRFVFIGMPWRPGFPGCATLVEAKNPIFRRGNLGVWGEFEFDQIPSLDLLASGATGAIELYLDLIQVRAGR